jgi:hypothetical protein
VKSQVSRGLARMEQLLAGSRVAGPSGEGGGY